MTTILAVEDNPVTSAVIEKEFGDCGFTVHSAGSAEVAFEKLENGLVCDIIILDFHLPGELGPQFYQRLKLNPKYKDIPIVPFSSQFETTTAFSDDIMAGYRYALQSQPGEMLRPLMVSKGFSDKVSELPGGLYVELRKALKAKGLPIPAVFNEKMRKALGR